MTTESKYHIPVLLKESVDGLALRKDSVVVDVTFGGGGHSAYILSQLSEHGFLYAFDQDLDAVSNALKAPNFKLLEANFKYLKNHLSAEGITQVDAILADIGVSSHQFDEEQRGFSFRADAPLDMRMNQRSGRTAASLINESSEEELLRVFNTYSDLNNVFRLVQALLNERAIKPFATTHDLTAVAKRLAPKNKEHKYLAQVFQALRIEVNDEIGALRNLLLDAADLLKKAEGFPLFPITLLRTAWSRITLKKGILRGKRPRIFRKPSSAFRGS